MLTYFATKAKRRLERWFSRWNRKSQVTGYYYTQHKKSSTFTSVRGVYFIRVLAVHRPTVLTAPI